MAERTSATQRLKLEHVAEREIKRYAGDHAMWHKHIHDIELDSVQILKMKEMDQYNNTIDFSSRRTRKTSVKELFNLEYLACNADQEEGIVAPRQAQAITNLNYHLEAIDRSPVLSNYIAHKNGRKQKADTKYQFANRSKAFAEGIMAQVDGGDLTMASLEEVDDMPKDRLYANFLLMLGATDRLGASKESKNDPQIRITGVYKGADTLTGLIDSGTYNVIGAFHGERAKIEAQRLINLGYLSKDSIELENYKYPIPIMHAVNAMEMGLLNKTFINIMRDSLSEDEFTRQLLCINTSGKNLVWEKYLRRAMMVGLEASLEMVQPLPGEKYKKRGLISFGYDHSGHGENPESSKYAFVVLEQIGSYTVPIFCRQWAPGTDEKIVRMDLLSYWRYFMPDVAMGDAYGIGMLTELNEELFNEGLTTIDRRAIGDGDSTASTWSEWAFAPIRFEGMTKHQMAQAVRNNFHTGHAAVPFIDDLDETNPDTADLRALYKQLINITPEVSKASYSIYKMANPKIGDDLFDSYMAALWGLVTRGSAGIETVISTRTRERKDLLGQPPNRLPSDPIMRANLVAWLFYFNNPQNRARL